MIKEFFSFLQEKISQHPIAGPIIGLASFLLIVSLGLSPAYELFELKLYDLRFRMKPSIQQWQFLTFLDIDDHSVNSAGQFPWPRSLYADGLGVLKEVGARQVAFDIQFPDESPFLADRAGIDRLSEKASAGGRISAEELRLSVVDNDVALAASIKSFAHAVIPYTFQTEAMAERDASPARAHRVQSSRKSFTARASVPVPAGREREFEPLIDHGRRAVLYPIPELVDTGASFGFVDSDFDIDGISRKIRMVRCFDGRIYFHMALVMLMDICGVRMDDVDVRPGDAIELKKAVHPVTFRRENIRIPIDGRGMMYIHWAGDLETTFNHVSFYNLIEYRNARDEIHDFFDSQDAATGGRRPALIAETARLRSELARQADHEKKRALMKKIEDNREEISRIELSYGAPVLDEIRAAREKLAGGENAEIERAIANLENYHHAIRLVVDVEKLSGHFGIVGLTATATQDIGVTPLSSQYMMVGTYHNIINTVLQNRFITKAGAVPNMLIMLLFALLMGWVIQRLTARTSLVTIVLSVLAANALITLLFVLGNLWLDQLGINLSLLIPSFAIAAVKFVNEESQKRFIKMAFSHYLSPKVIDSIIKNPEAIKLGGESRRITTFFSDVAKFSTISESLSPTELVSLLNEYLSEMTDIILGYDGTVDKFEGDAIMAFFGAPQVFPDHAARACFAALDMQRKLGEMRARWREQGRHELFVRMGMNTGEAVVGNMGSRTRMDYTVMGDSVNLASRLEGANKFYSTGIMISEFTRTDADDAIEVRQLDRIRVVGKEEPIVVYELLARKGELDSDTKDMLEKYDAGLDHFKEREWEKARSLFRAGLKIIPGDGPCATYVERCTEFMKSPPSRNWDGVYRMKTK